MNIRRFTLSTALLGAASLLPLSSGYAQTATATTVPVGYQQVTVAAAIDSVNPTGSVISVPFYQPAIYAGLVTSVDSASTLSSSTANWTANQFTTTPYLIHLKSGPSVGRYFLITANTATQLTVSTRGYDLTQVAATNNTFEIVPTYTLATLFGASTVPFQTGTNFSTADNVLLWDGTIWSIYYHNGTNWRRSGSLTNQNNVIIYPDEGIYITRRATSALALTFLGTVPSANESSDLVGPGSTFLSNRFPVDITLSNVGFQNLPNWLNGTNVAVADNVYLWNGTAWNLYYFNGTNWRRSGSLQSADATVIPSGSAVFVVRKSNASGANSSLVQALPYSLN